MSPRRLERFWPGRASEPGGVELLEEPPRPIAWHATGAALRLELIRAGVLAPQLPREPGDPSPEMPWVASRPCLSMRGDYRPVTRRLTPDELERLEHRSNGLASAGRRFDHD